MPKKLILKWNAIFDEDQVWENYGLCIQYFFIKDKELDDAIDIVEVSQSDGRRTYR